MAADTTLLDEIRVRFPFLASLGIEPEQLHTLAIESGGNDEVALQLIRQTPQYQSRFPAIVAEDGSRRMSEAEYIQTENDFRELARQHGYSLKGPGDYVELFESEQDPEEFGQRLTVHAQIRDGSSATRDAFYVYAGMDVSVDDLFEAAFDADAGERLAAEYRERVVLGTFDYQTFIDRVVEVAGQRVATFEIGDSTVIRSVQQNPELVGQLLDVLYTGGEPAAGGDLSLEELLAAFEEALIGSAAVGAGLELPTRERAQELRTAGVQRAQAQQAYLQYALEGTSLSAAATRAGRGPIDQEKFVNATLLGEGDALRDVTTAQAYQDAIGRRGGTFRFDLERDQLVQRGLTS